MKTPIIASVAALVLSLPALAAEGWLVDYEAAKAKASSEKKELLLDFTGSDWCTWCIRLRKEVFEEESFKKAAPEQFVLVELDFPQDSSKQPAAVKAQNEKLRDQFEIEGYPSIILADAEGRPYAKTGYQKGGAAEYLKHLEELRAKGKARDAAFKRAEGASGLEKAKALSEGLAEVPEGFVPVFYKATLDQIRSLDAADTLGVDARFGLLKDMSALRTALSAKRESGGGEAVRSELDKFFSERPKLGARQKQQTLLEGLKFMAPPKDNRAALKLVEDVVALDKNSQEGKTAEQIRERIEKRMAK